LFFFVLFVSKKKKENNKKNEKETDDPSHLFLIVNERKDIFFFSSKKDCIIKNYINLHIFVLFLDEKKVKKEMSLVFFVFRFCSIIAEKTMNLEESG